MRTIEWLNLNSSRRYPLRDDCNYTTQLVGPGTEYLFQNDVLLDFKIITYDLAIDKITLETFEVIDNSPAAKTIKLTFKLWYTDATTLLIYVTVPENAVCPYSTNAFIEDTYNVKFVLGAGIVALATFPFGVYQFNTPPEMWESLIIMHHMHSVNIIKGTDAGSVDLNDIVYFEEGYGISIDTDIDDNSITIAAIPGTGKGFSCEKLPYVRDNTITRSINGIKPGADGNLELTGIKGIKVTTDLTNHIVYITSTLDRTNVECGEE
ncbi:hypothetical protein ACFLQL_00305 [Verrucomicrobiota bacterium]